MTVTSSVANKKRPTYQTTNKPPNYNYDENYVLLFNNYLFNLKITIYFAFPTRK